MMDGYDKKVQCCGNCMHHVPTKRTLRIKKNTYNSNTCFWDCGISKKPKKLEQGKECVLFENRYYPEDKSEEWIGNVYK